jgi:hypothetical protein
MLTVYVPSGVAFHCFEANGVVNGAGRTIRHYARQHQDRTVVDLPRSAFVSLLQGRDGLHWESANPAALQWIGENKGEPTYPVFPGENYAPPIAPSAPAAPVMVRMLAPDGVTSTSVEGKELAIGDDRTLTVTDTVAETLRCHGFVAA